MNEVISEEISALFKERIPCQVGFIQARLFEELRAPLTYSIEKGYDSGLIHASVEERINPFLILPNAKTIIVIAVPYTSRDETLKHQRYVVSRSSWGTDYHLVLQDVLQEVSEELKKRYGATSVTLTDNHMLHDRHLAMLAGLGHYGKNTLLINDRYGSFFFIGSIVTDLTLDEYEYTKETPRDICGSCDRCIKACPTGAISEERYLNAKRCLSYLTQSKEEIPDFLLDKLRKFPFGCDFCQLACPYNQDITTDILYRFRPTGKERITPHDLVPLSNRTFKERYGDLACSFRGKNVLLRNTLVIAANTQDETVLPLLSRIDDHGLPYLQQALHYAKKRLGYHEEGDDNIAYTHRSLQS